MFYQTSLCFFTLTLPSSFYLLFFLLILPSGVCDWDRDIWIMGFICIATPAAADGGSKAPPKEEKSADADAAPAASVASTTAAAKPAPASLPVSAPAATTAADIDLFGGQCGPRLGYRQHGNLAAGRTLSIQKFTDSMFASKDDGKMFHSLVIRRNNSYKNILYYMSCPFLLPLTISTFKSWN